MSCRRKNDNRNDVIVIDEFLMEGPVEIEYEFMFRVGSCNVLESFMTEPPDALELTMEQESCIYSYFHRSPKKGTICDAEARSELPNIQFRSILKEKGPFIVSHINHFTC